MARISMPRDQQPLPRGVTSLDRPRGGRPYRASIRHRGVECHLGLYESPYLAGLAYHLAAEMVGRRSSPPDEEPGTPRASASQIRTLSARVASRLGIKPTARLPVEEAPPIQALITFFEVTVLGFWKQQAASDHADAPGSSLDSAASRVVEAADLLLIGRAAVMPPPLEMLVDLLARRLDVEFRRSDLTREILDDDGDDPWRVARWLVYPEHLPTGRGFRREVSYLYPEFFAEDPTGRPGWAEVLGIVPPYSIEKIRDAYRLRSKTVHPDKGGSAAEFVRVQEAYEEGMSEHRGFGS